MQGLSKLCWQDSPSETKVPVLHDECRVQLQLSTTPPEHHVHPPWWPSSVLSMEKTGNWPWLIGGPFRLILDCFCWPPSDSAPELYAFPFLDTYLFRYFNARTPCCTYCLMPFLFHYYIYILLPMYIAPQTCSIELLWGETPFHILLYFTYPNT